MKTLLITIFAICINTMLISQGKLDPDDTLRQGDEVPKILLIGTYHFSYPGQDTHKTAEDKKVDILSDLRQKQLNELLGYIEKYKPTKIMLESGRNTGYLMNRYRRWKKGEEELYRNERDQVGIKLLDRLGLDTLYGIDASSLSYEWSTGQDSTHANVFLDKIYDETPEDVKENLMEARYWEWYAQDDTLTYDMSLLEYFKYQNKDKVINRMHGHYILNDGSKSYNDVDGFILNLYSRNLRIYKNIISIDTKSTDRVLVLMGAAHIAVLKNQFESTPEYELVKFKDLEKF